MEDPGLQATNSVWATEWEKKNEMAFNDIKTTNK